LGKKIFECVSCGNKPLSKNEVGINKKLLGAKSESFYCLECLADFLEVSPQDLLDKIEDFKNEGCKLFE